VEQPVDVVEDVLLGQSLARVGGLEVGEAGVGERGAPATLWRWGLGNGDWGLDAGEEVGLGGGGGAGGGGLGFVVQVEGEALSTGFKRIEVD